MATTLTCEPGVTLLVSHYIVSKETLLRKIFFSTHIDILQVVLGLFYVLQLFSIKLKSREDDKWMSGSYTEAGAEAKMMWDAQSEAQKKADSTEQERKVVDPKKKKDFQRKLKEFTRALQTKFSDKTMKRSVYSLAKLVLIPRNGDTKLNSDGFHLRYTVRDGAAIWVGDAMTVGPKGNGDGTGGIEGDPPSGSQSSSYSLSSSSSSDSQDDDPPLLPPSRGMDNSKPRP
ncbi:hypothetical protein BDD12DRAFT_895051 [Trichophaea hybrida]|nr:hypothetical protein BDD12DRAFT_895051 [Trichophaea hybrida]